jgi:predicted metal-binding membrane protein
MNRCPGGRVMSAAASAHPPPAPESNHAAVPALPIRDRAILWTALAMLTALAWLYLIRMPMTPADVGGFGARILLALPSSLASAWLTFMMWAVMMVAMMTPSASPMVLAYARIARSHADTPASAVWLFAAAYLFVWTLFSAVAAAGQIALERAALLSGALTTTPVASGVILVAAGVYQFTPLKGACLGSCRSPLGFFMTAWRAGAIGAFRMGLRHGTYCVGCCWTLMLLLFVLGVMNLLWVAAISALILLEKAAPWGRNVARTAAVLMIAGGVIVAFRP